MNDEHPVADAERGQVAPRDDFNVLSPIEFEAVVRAVANDVQKVALLSTAFYAGLRVGELHELRWADIDFPASIIVVRAGSSFGERSMTKGKRVRSVPVVDVLAHRLEMLTRRERFIDDDDYVFCDEVGARFDDDKAREDFYAALKAAGMGQRREKVDKHGEPQKPMVFHDLRHSFCTWPVNVFTVPVRDATLQERFARMASGAAA
jgi:integrase